MDKNTWEKTLQDLYNGHDFELLKAKAEEAIAASPKEGFPYYYLAQAEMSSWDYEAAIEAYSAALERQPAEPSYLKGLAEAYRDNSQNEEAIATYQELIALTKESEYMLQAAQLYANQWQNEQALALLDRVLAKEPKHADANRQKARLLSNEQKHEEAIACINLVLEQNPKDVAALRDRIWFNQGLDNAKAVDKDYRALIDAEADSAQHYLDYAAFLQEQLQYIEAEEIYNKALELEERQGAQFASSFLARAKLRLEMAKETDALEDAMSALTRDEHSTEARYVMAQAFHLLGSAETAIQALDQALELEPFNSSPYYALRGQIHSELGNWQAAEADLQQWRTESYDSPESLMALGMLYKEQGDLEEAYVYWSQVAEYNDEAMELIETHCAEIHEAAQAEAEAASEEQRQSWIAEYAEYAEANAQNPIIQEACKHTWGVDTDKLGDIPIPGGFADAIRMMFQTVSIRFSPERIELQLPIAEEALQSVYRIEEGGKENEVYLHVQALEGGEARYAALRLGEDGELQLLGFQDFLNIPGMSLGQDEDEDEDWEEDEDFDADFDADEEDWDAEDEDEEDEGGTMDVVTLRKLNEKELAQMQDADSKERIRATMEDFFGGLMSMFDDQLSAAFGGDEDEDEDEEEEEE